MGKKEVFVIINSYFIGDILLTNSLVQNIKRLYPESTVISITNSELVDIAKYQEGVDEVIIWDRKNVHKNFWGMLKFIWNFPYKNIYACFPIYGLDRPILLSWLLGAEYILAPDNGFFSKFLKKSKYKYSYDGEKTQTQILSVLKGITKEDLADCPIKFNLPENSNPVSADNYIAFIPTSSRESKDIPPETIISILKTFSEKKFVLLGQGTRIKNISNAISEEKLENVIDFTNKTTLQEAAVIIKNADLVITADTGLMHLACALGVKSVAIFYENSTPGFVPSETMYDIKVIKDDVTTQNIVNTLKNYVRTEVTSA